MCTVEPLNKGQGQYNNTNSTVLSFVERSSSPRTFSMYGKYKEWQFKKCPLNSDLA